jgi:hypothetical protein
MKRRQENELEKMIEYENKMEDIRRTNEQKML